MRNTYKIIGFSLSVVGTLVFLISTILAGWSGDKEVFVPSFFGTLYLVAVCLGYFLTLEDS